MEGAVISRAVGDLPRRRAIDLCSSHGAGRSWAISVPVLPLWAIVGSPGSRRLSVVVQGWHMVIAHVVWVGGSRREVLHWQVVVAAPCRSWIHAGFFIQKITHIHDAHSLALSCWDILLLTGFVWSLFPSSFFLSFLALTGSINDSC